MTCPNGSGVIDACTNTSIPASSAHTSSKASEVDTVGDPQDAGLLAKLDAIRLVRLAEHGLAHQHGGLGAVAEGSREGLEKHVLALPPSDSADHADNEASTGRQRGVLGLQDDGIADD
jgi:hypothetical protein